MRFPTGGIVREPLSTVFVNDMEHARGKKVKRANRLNDTDLKPLMVWDFFILFLSKNLGLLLKISFYLKEVLT